MRFLSWHDGLNLGPARRRGKRGQPRSLRRERPGCKLNVEALECRTVPAFLTPVEYTTGPNSLAVVAADFNGNHILDLAVVNISSSDVSILLGNGDGTFQPAVSSSTGAYPRSLAVGDFDGDGHLDIATVNDSVASVLLGHGDGTFAAPNHIDAAGLGSSPASVAVGDFNDDGRLDLGVASNLYVFDGYYSTYYGYYPFGHNEGYANVLLGNGDGTFGAPNTTDLGIGYHRAAVAPDLNGDGASDFATVNDYGSVSVALGSAGGYLTGAGEFYAGYYPDDVAAGDVNGDGRLDLVTANYSDVGVLLGNSAGSFDAVQNYATGGYPTSVVLGDFTGDGKVDVLTANPNSGNVSVLYGVGSGSLSAPVNFAASAGSYNIDVAADDFNGDGWLDAATANYYYGGSASILINDRAWAPPNAPQISINDVSVTEGNTGSVNGTFTISLSNVYSLDVTVHYDTADGSATAGSDYTGASGDVTIPAGQTSRTVTVAVLGDRLAEPTETFVVNLSSPVNGFIADSQGVGTILDNEPRITINNVTKKEGNGGTTQYSFTVSLSAVSDQPVTVNYATADGTATAGSDYQEKHGTLTIPAGAKSATIKIVVIRDKTQEADETLYVNLSSPSSNAYLFDPQGFGTILNDDRRGK